MKLSVFMILQVLWNSEWCAAKALEQGSVTETGEVTPYPDTQKQIINVNNVSPEVTNILRDHNMSFDQINALKEKLIRENRTMNRNFYEVIPSTTYSTPAATKDFDELMRLNSIRNSLEKTLRESDDSDQHSNAEFDYSLAAVCEIPPHAKLADWFGQKSWNIYFKPNYRQYNIKSVTLRLFKVSQATKVSKECDPDVGEFFKLVVSVYSRKRRENKKKTIYVEMIASNFNGWVEINALSTLKFWDLPRSNFGMSIDVYDQDDNQLDAKEHFHLQNCEAGPQIPWGAFELLAKSHRTDVSQDVVALYRDLYTGPRLDIKSSTSAKYSISSTENQQSQPEQQKITRHLRHTHHRHHHLQRSNEVESSEESSPESYSHQLNAKRQDHSHRTNRKVEET